VFLQGTSTDKYKKSWSLDSLWPQILHLKSCYIVP